MNHKSPSNAKDPELASRYDTVGSTQTNVADGFTMAAVGDLIVTRPLTRANLPGFQSVLNIIRNADVTFGNMETNVFDIRSFTGSPQAEYGGAYHVSLPALGPDLKEMGFNLLSCANNHLLDWGVEGMRETSRVLDANGIVHAGIGENLAQAGAARFLETPRGRVSLVSFAATFTPLSRACDSAGEAPGRPGINGLRVARTVVVTPGLMDSLRQLRNALPDAKHVAAAAKATPAATERAASLEHADEPDRLVVAGLEYKVGERVGYSFEPDRHDVAGIVKNVRRGKQFSDFCIATNHGHQPGNWSQAPADYEQAFARSLIDAGADAYVVHGPHQLRGIEIYKGRPIFYSVGNFIMDDLRTPVGADMFAAHDKDPVTDTDADVTVAEMRKGFSGEVFYESVVTVSRYEHNQLVELRLYPIELGHAKRFANRGVPQLAAAPQAQAILERMRELSQPFGTEIAIENDVGVIRLPRVSS